MSDTVVFAGNGRKEVHQIKAFVGAMVVVVYVVVVVVVVLDDEKERKSF